MRHKRNKKSLIVSVAVLSILIIGVGYAFLTTKLNINGTAITKGNTWDIHFENVQVDSGSVEADDPIINTAKDTVTYSVTLPEPGDYYTFDVDIVNAGTIDGMIDVITTPTFTAAQEKYFEFSTTYSDGTELSKYDLLFASSNETIKLTIQYKKDITSTDLPTSDQTIDIKFGITYVQADENAKEVPVFMSKEKFKNFASTNTPTEIVFTNIGASTGTDISENQNGSILA